MISVVRMAGRIAAGVLAGTMSIATVSAAEAQSAPPVQIIRVPCDSAALPGAIAAANTTGTAIIRLARDCTYTTIAPLTITGANVTIIGGPSTAVRESPATGSVFIVAAAATLRAAGFFILGGNSAGVGGGISVLGTGTLVLRNMTISGNAAATTGGGINIAATGTATIIRSIIKANTATASGGGISNLGTLRLFESLVSGNNAVVSGGGIFNSGTATIVQSTIDRNTTAGTGGGIQNAAGGTVRLVRTLVRHNKASTVALGSGGGINNAGAVGSVTLDQPIVRRNSPDNCAPAGSVPGCLG
jgi:hypothetical protein